MHWNIILTSGLLMLALCFPHAKFDLVEAVTPSGHPVHNLETDLSYVTIQEAIDAPETLDTQRILVDNGTYYENINVTKAVTLIGESEETTIIDGMGVDWSTVVKLSSNNVTITGFTLRNSGIGWAKSGIALDTVGNCNVSGNNITNNYYGIWLQTSSDNIISGNNFANNGYGIGLYASSNRNSILENNVTASGHAGILLVSSTENNLSRNNLAHDEYSIELISSSNNTITENNLVNNSHGVALYESSNDNDVIGNNVQKNGWGFETDTSAGNRIYHNSFINNTPQVYFYGSGYPNVWDTGFPEGGNYWSSYNGTDSHTGFYQNETGSDGIGDAPYSIDNSNEDHYPLMGILHDFIVFLPPYPTGRTEHISVVSNSTVSGLSYFAWLNSTNQYIQTGQMLIQFSTTDENEETGFCRLMIPRAALNATSYVVLVDWKPVKVTELPTSDIRQVYLYFTYVNSLHEITVTPEFPLIALLTVLLVTSLSAIAFKRNRVNYSARTR